MFIKRDVVDSQKKYKGVRCYHVTSTGTWDVAYADSSSSYSYIAPSVCTYGDSVMLACGKGDLAATVFAAKIYPLLGSYNSSTYQFGSYPGDMFPSGKGSGYGKCLDVDIAPAGETYFHIVSRGGELKHPESPNREFVFYHAHWLKALYHNLNVSSGYTTTKTMNSDDRGNVLAIYKRFDPVEENSVGCPRIADNGSSGFFCVIPKRGNNDKNQLLVFTSTLDPYPGVFGSNAHLPTIIPGPNGDGGFLAWSDYPNPDWSSDFANGQNSNIYLARLGSDGDYYGSPWSTNKVVCSKTGPQSSPRLVLIDNNNVVVVWSDKRQTSWNRWKIYAQCYNISTGNPAW